MRKILALAIAATIITACGDNSVTNPTVTPVVRPDSVVGVWTCNEGRSITVTRVRQNIDWTATVITGRTETVNGTPTRRCVTRTFTVPNTAAVRSERQVRDEVDRLLR